MVPKGWKFGPASNIVSFLNGFAFKSQDATDTGAKWLKIANVGVGEVKWDDQSYLPYDYYQQYSQFELKSGDIVVAMTRPTLGDYLKIAKLVDENDRSLLNQRVAKLLIKDTSVPDFVYQLFRTSSIAKRINAALLGTDPPNLSVSVLDELMVGIPPHPEQRKIAQILSTWDKAIATTERLLANKQQQKKALMQRLLTGKQRFAGFEGEWRTYKQGDVARFYNGRAYKLSEWEESGTPVIRLQNLTGRGSDYYYSNLELPNHQYCSYGDLLYMWSATFGPHIWKGQKAIYHYHIWKVECDEAVLDKAFMYYVLDFETQKWLSKSNGMGLLHITKETMEKQLIAIPSVDEQKQIAQVLTNADLAISKTAKHLTNLKSQKKALMQQLLTGKRRVKVDEVAA